METNKLMAQVEGLKRSGEVLLKTIDKVLDETMEASNCLKSLMSLSVIIHIDSKGGLYTYRY